MLSTDLLEKMSKPLFWADKCREYGDAWWLSKASQRIVDYRKWVEESNGCRTLRALKRKKNELSYVTGKIQNIKCYYAGQVRMDLKAAIRSCNWAIERLERDIIMGPIYNNNI